MRVIAGIGFAGELGHVLIPFERIASIWRHRRSERSFSALVHHSLRRGMPDQRVEQRDVPIHVMPGRDTAGARGAALEAIRQLRETEAGAR